MQIIDGKKVSAQVKQEVKNETELLKKRIFYYTGTCRCNRR